MQRVPTWMTVAVLVVTVIGLSACKSRTRNTSRVPSTAPAPMIAQPSYPPPAPSYPAEPIEVPSVSQADVDAAKDAAALERARNEDLERQLRLEQERVARTEGRIQDLENKLAELPPQPVPSPDLDAAMPIDNAGRLADDIRAKSASTVIRDGDMVIVRVTNGFRAGQDLLKQDVQLVQTLNATADALSRYPGATVAVVGHSDTDPIRKSKWASNDELSMARAQRVAQVLADNGVDRNRISIDGRGSREPIVAPERTARDKATNRRVEIMIRP
jgi:flagellar motor protein MotB